MPRWLSVLLILGILAAVALAGLLGIPRPPGPRQVRFAPLALPSDYADRLTVLDYPWPHPHAQAPADRFDGLPAVTYEDRLQAAIAAFRRRYPRVRVEYRLLDFASGPAEVLAAARSGAADVVAVFWHGPELPAELRVPLERYLDPQTRAAVYPAAWRLAARDRTIWAVPRWLALHPWLARPGSPPPEPGTVADAVRYLAAAGEGGAGFVTLDGFPWLLGELLAGLPAGSQAGAAQALAGALTALRSAAAGGGDGGAAPAPLRAILDGRYLLAGGLGPGLAHRLYELAAAQAGAPPELVAPPRLVDGQAGGIPVSLGGYAVLRGPETTRAHAQVAVELALHLAAWEPERAAARMLAVPAWRAAARAWEEESPLPEPLRRRLLEQAEQPASGAQVLRAYAPAAALSPAHPDHAALVEAWSRFWRGDDAALPAIVRSVLPGP